MKQFSTKTAKKLQKKASRAADEKLVQKILGTDISGLSRDEAKAKLKNAVDSLNSD